MHTTETITLRIIAQSIARHERIMRLGNIQDKASFPSKLLKPRLQLTLPGHLKGRENSCLFNISVIMGMLCLNRKPVLSSLLA